MKPLWSATTNRRRTFRVRTNVFFVFAFPMILILVPGATFGGSSSPRLGVVSEGSGGPAVIKAISCWQSGAVPGMPPRSAA